MGYRDIRDAISESLGCGGEGGILSAEDYLELRAVRMAHYQRLVSLTFIGLLSTLRPSHFLAARAALSALEKVIVATPRLWPFGPYVRRTFLIGPISLLKYS